MNETDGKIIAMKSETERPKGLCEAHAQRIAALVAEINLAYRHRDYKHLAKLGNRLATDGVIAQALSGEAPLERKAG